MNTQVDMLSPLYYSTLGYDEELMKLIFMFFYFYYNVQ